jgi:hypothetical protein
MPMTGKPGRAGGVGNRRPATVAVPAQDLAGEAQASQGVRARGEIYAPGRHVEDVRSACGVEHVHAIEEMGERLAIRAIADEAEAAGWGDVACDAARVAAPAPKWKVQGHV